MPAQETNVKRRVMMNGLIRKLKRRLGYSYSKSDLDALAQEMIVRSSSFSGVERLGNELRFRYHSMDLTARLSPHSDTSVANQVLINKEYLPVVDFFKVNFPGYKKLRIIDAGANVGYSTVFFLSFFPDSEVACVEPDAANLEVLARNLAPFIKSSQVRLYRNGILNCSGKSIHISNDFRDGRDWSISVKETLNESELKSISISEIVGQMNWDAVDLLKVDIEGSEKSVFEDDNCMDFLQITSAVAVEIHDEFDCRDLVYNRLLSAGFVVFNFGETTFGVNKKEWAKG